ncbi:MAG: hypothetical protein ACXVCY_18170 [Pseudobdellovibrionaceae bacterium]
MITLSFVTEYFFSEGFKNEPVLYRITILFSHASADEKLNVHTRAVLDQLNTINKKEPLNDCSEESNDFPNLEKRLGPALSDPLRYWKSRSCEEFFQSSAPDWLQSVSPQNSSISLKNWWPVCTLTNLNAIRYTHKNISDPQELLSKLDKYTLKMDLCSQGEKAMRGGKGYIPPSQNKADLSIMPVSKRREYKKLIETLKDKTAAFCCESNQECKEQFKRISIVWCKPKNDPNSSDPCVEDANEFDSYNFMSSEEKEKIHQFLKV